MSTLLIGNSYNDYLVGDLSTFTPDERSVAGNISVRMLWLAQPGNIVVLPQPPDRDFLRYLGEIRGIDTDEIEIVVPPPGAFGAEVLTRDRLTMPDVSARLRTLVTDRGVDRILPYVFDRTVTRLAAQLGLDERTPGFGFAAGGGTDLLNSKSVFRAIAGGIGVPHTTGITSLDRTEAEEFVAELIGTGLCAIVKQDFHAGGYGNEILAPDPGVRKIGAAKLSVLTGRDAAARHVANRWMDYTNDGRAPVVIEHYLPESAALGAELDVTDDGMLLHHFGEMRMKPIFDGIAIYRAVTAPAVGGAFLDAVLRLCQPVQAMGYRGLINIDGIVTPDERMLLTEFNGRLGGTTHLDRIGRDLLGPGYFDSHVMLTRNHWPVPSTKEALRRIRSAGIGFDTAAGSGVLVTGDHTAQVGVLEYCAVAKDVPTAEAMEKVVGELFPQAGQRG